MSHVCIGMSSDTLGDLAIYTAWYNGQVLMLSKVCTHWPNGMPVVWTYISVKDMCSVLILIASQKWSHDNILAGEQIKLKVSFMHRIVLQVQCKCNEH